MPDWDDARIHYWFHLTRLGEKAIGRIWTGAYIWAFAANDEVWAECRMTGLAVAVGVSCRSYAQALRKEPPTEPTLVA